MCSKKSTPDLVLLAEAEIGPRQIFVWHTCIGCRLGAGFWLTDDLPATALLEAAPNFLETMDGMDGVRFFLVRWSRKKRKT